MSIVIDKKIETSRHDQKDAMTNSKDNNIKISVDKFSFYYENTQALKNIDLKIKENTVVGIIGPSGCGKSTFLRCFNRMNDTDMGKSVVLYID